MVGKWTPEPPREPLNEDLSMVGAEAAVMELESSDSEEETLPNDGYELLPQQIPSDGHDSEETDDTDESSDDDSIEDPEESSLSNPSLPLEENELASPSQSNVEQERPLEVSSSSISDSVEMARETIERIRAVMANVTLPPSAVPSWAANVSVEELKQLFLDDLRRLQQTANKRDRSEE